MQIKHPKEIKVTVEHNHQRGLSMACTHCDCGKCLSYIKSPLLKSPIDYLYPARGLENLVWNLSRYLLAEGWEWINGKWWCRLCSKEMR